MGHHNSDNHSSTSVADRSVALVGAPNSGKSSLFNQLTGLRVKTANYPGVTVTLNTGSLRTDDGETAVWDLPGTYSLTPMSPDEQILVDHLRGELRGVDRPDAVLVVIDSTVLPRSLALTAEVLSLELPTAVVLTMVDELRARGGSVDVHALERALGVPVFEVVAHRGTGVPDVVASLGQTSTWSVPVVLPPRSNEHDLLDAWIDSVTERCAYRPPGPSGLTRKLDAVLLHPLAGLTVFVAVMVTFFQLLFVVATPLMGLIESVFAALGDRVSALLGESLVADFVDTAILGGIGGVLVFLPQIAILFAVLALLESTGYLARVAVLVDRLMALTGLDGRAFVAMLSSVACAIPGIMATRTLPSSRSRLATIMAAPLMTCSARLPVYLLLVGMLVPPGEKWGPFGLQGLTLFLLYLAGGVSALLAAWVFKATALRSGDLPFFLELPPYRWPSVRGVVAMVWLPVKVFLRKVGTIILLATTVLWVLLSFPAQPQTASMSDAAASSYVLDHSYAATIGRAIEPVFEPLGFNWQINVGLVSAMAARETFVTTMGQVVAAEDPEDPAESLKDMRYDEGPDAGSLVFTAPVIVALLVWFVYAMQCVSTLAVMRRETNSWRWPVTAFSYMTILAWIMAFVAHQITVVATT